MDGKRKIYVTADLHLGHGLVSRLRGFDSVEEHTQSVVDAWNSIVQKQDLVWVLGDAIWNKKTLDVVAGTMTGTKKLVLGNHDQMASHRYLKMFQKVYGCAAVGDVILTHIPVHPTQVGKDNRYRLNVHGHTHAAVVRGPDGKPDLRYRSVSLEQTGMAPVLLEDVIR